MLDIAISWPCRLSGIIRGFKNGGYPSRGILYPNSSLIGFMDSFRTLSQMLLTTDYQHSSMASIVDNVMGMLSSGDNLSTMGKSVGGDEKSVKSALSMGLPLLMGSMADKASKPGGAEMLTKMIPQEGAGNPDNISSQLSNPPTAGGSDMVSKLMGNQMGPMQNAISKKSGLAPDGVGKLLAMVAPILMGQVGKMFSQGNMDSKGLSALLGSQSKMAMQSSPEASDLSKQMNVGTTENGGFMSKLTHMFKK
jgi:hypothetical protein